MQILCSGILPYVRTYIDTYIHTHTLLSAHVEPVTKQWNIWYTSAQSYREREKVLIRSIAKQDTWPKEKSELMNKYLKYFTQFANSIDFDKLRGVTDK